MPPKSKNILYLPLNTQLFRVVDIFNLNRYIDI